MVLHQGARSRSFLLTCHRLASVPKYPGQPPEWLRLPPRVVSKRFFCSPWLRFPLLVGRYNAWRSNLDGRGLFTGLSRASKALARFDDVPPNHHRMVLVDHVMTVHDMLAEEVV